LSNFEPELQRRLEALRQSGLRRQLRRVNSPQSPHLEIDGRWLLNFSSNDYLGLANHPDLKRAAVEAVERFGAGAGASRLISGSLGPHEELDETLAAFKGTEAALSFSTGYAAALGTICALLGKGDIIILDRLVHASIIDAARLSGGTIRVFAHNDLDRLEDILKWADKKSGNAGGVSSGLAATECRSTLEPDPARRPQMLVVTESVFSMDGDHAPLREIAALKDKYGAWLMVDEAHAGGLYGTHRRGLAEALGVEGRIEIQMGTLGKAMGASGGYIGGSRTLIDYLVNTARSFIFSTAPVPAAAAAATAGLRLARSEAGAQRCDLLWKRVGEIDSALPKANARTSGPSSAIIPLILGDETRAVEASAALRDQGIFVPAIRYPSVARGQARLRLTVSAAHEAADVQRLLEALRTLGLLDPKP
jgi:7-keto-8-aminopelargonate synthetase-like enzyme